MRTDPLRITQWTGLEVLRSWLRRQLVILWREKHPDAAYQLQLDLADNDAQKFNPRLVEIDL